MKTTLLSLVLVLFVSARVHAADSTNTAASQSSIAKLVAARNQSMHAADSTNTAVSQSSISTLVVAKKQTVPLGDPIIVSLSVSNQAPQVKWMDSNPTAFGGFEVTDPDGKTLPYVGRVYQRMLNTVAVQPHSTVTIAEALDLTGDYLFQKEGRYSIRFSGGVGLAKSTAIAIEVTAGRLSEFDAVIASLLPVCTNGWFLAKIGDEGTSTPVGPGIALSFHRNPIGGNTVQLSLTKEEAKVDPNQQLSGKLVYLGQARGRFVHALVGENALASWPTAIEDISRALGIPKQ